VKKEFLLIAFSIACRFIEMGDATDFYNERKSFPDHLLMIACRL
jgi:hypothetical protein